MKISQWDLRGGRHQHAQHTAGDNEKGRADLVQTSLSAQVWSDRWKLSLASHKAIQQLLIVIAETSALKVAFFRWTSKNDNHFEDLRKSTKHSEIT